MALLVLTKKLRDMIKSWCPRGEKLAVGRLEYKEIIEMDKELGITCTCDDIAVELMWGIKNLMHVLVPQEQKVLTKEERLAMSKGLEMTMCRHGIVANLEMSIGWDTMKLATALKKISCPEEEVEHSAKMFSQDELLKIKKDADKYKNKICKESISQIYTELVYAYKGMDVKLEGTWSRRHRKLVAKMLNQTEIANARG